MKKYFYYSCFAIFTVLTACGGGSGSSAATTNITAADISSIHQACTYTGDSAVSTTTKIINAIPARTQWNENSGYCGETSMLSAGLYYGQYVSQYTARSLGDAVLNPPLDQITGELLIGTYGHYGPNHPNNSITGAATAMHLNYQEYNQKFNRSGNSKRPSADFFAWIKQNVVAKYPVIIGVYENSSVFGQSPPDPEYDHIVPVFGISSTTLTSGVYSDSDVIYLHDNGLFTGSGYSPAGCYQYQVGPFQKSRKAADRASAGVYSVSDNSNQGGNYGITITGVMAENINLLPISIQTTPTFESPEIEHHSNTQPAPEIMKLAITVSDLLPKTDYVLMEYNSFTALPNNAPFPNEDDFSKSVGTPANSCIINLSSGNSFVRNETILSNQIVIYRAALKSSLPAFTSQLPNCE